MTAHDDPHHLHDPPERLRRLQRRLRDVFPPLAVSRAETERQAGAVQLELAFEPDARLMWSTDLDQLETAIDVLEQLTARPDHDEGS